MKHDPDTFAWRDVLAFPSQLYLLFQESLGSPFRGKVSYRQTMAQMADMGAGSLLIACVTMGFSGAAFWNSLQSMTSVEDQVQGLIKCVPFAIIIATVCCRQGLFTTGDARGVGCAATSGVVLSMAFVYITDYFLSVILQG